MTDWRKIQELTDALKSDAEEMTLDEFIDKWSVWVFPFWDIYNKHPDHDKQLFGDDDE